MPLVPAGLSSFNEKVESARKGFNSTLDKAGQKSGVFKGPANPKSPSSSSLPPPPPISSRPPPPYTHPSKHPPPPPPTRIKPGAPPPPPPRRASNLPTPFARQASNPPPPPSRANLPPRRFGSNSSAQNNHAFEQESSQPAPPPVDSKPATVAGITTYRPPPSSINGYGPPNMAPVQPTSRYGPPSPPRSSSELHDESVGFESVNPRWPQQSYPDEPSPPITAKKPTNWQKPGYPQLKNLSNPPRFLHQKHGQIPFPPFSQFTHKDKEAFFTMLDEFFDRRFPDRQPSGQRDSPQHSKDDIHPPQVSLQTRPSMVNLSPQDEQASRAELIARYFKTYRQWTSASDQWFLANDPVPPPMQGASDVKRMSCWSQTGNLRTQTNYVIFPDLSQLWTEVRFDVSRLGSPPQHAAARFRPPPAQIQAHTLVESSEIYGTQIVLFAENAEQSRRHVARGECWDMANEALKAFPADHFQVPPPLTSISRTHGIMLYYGRSTGPGSGHGSWKQRNDFGVVRPGDIIEWRLVACETANPALSFTLGDPDHTAIIVDVSGCTIPSSRSPDACPPTHLGLITVVEQSLKQTPIRRTYNLATISQGEVWIYRPMAEEALLGPGGNECSFPPPGPSFEPS